MARTRGTRCRDAREGTEPSRGTGSTSATVLAGDPELCQLRGESLEVVHARVERRDLEDRPRHRLAKVEPDAPAGAASERDVTAPDPAAHADRRDPPPGPFDPPADDVRDRDSQLIPAEARRDHAVLDRRPGLRW